MKKELEKRLVTSLILIPTSIFFIIKGSIFFIFFLSILFLITSYEWIKMNMNKNVFIQALGIIFLFISFYFAYLLRSEQGYEIFLLVILISILTDVGGYIFGKIFKGPKLTKISPKKTYSGVIGSFTLSIIGSLTFIEYMNLKRLLEYLNSRTIDPQNIFSSSLDLDLFILFFILISSLISQLGDLTISYFKRIAEIKDTGKILPGHGGLLDRIDGIIFNVPFVYLILKFGGVLF